MNKVLVEVLLPASGEVYDVRISLDSQLGEVAMLIVKQLEDLSNGRFIANDTTVLCDAESGKILDINKFVAELGIKNGSRLMLI